MATKREKTPACTRSIAANVSAAEQEMVITYANENGYTVSELVRAALSNQYGLQFVRRDNALRGVARMTPEQKRSYYTRKLAELMAEESR